jgi:hypothetical protein
MDTGLRLKPRLRREVEIAEAIHDGVQQAQAHGVLGKHVGAMLIRQAIRDHGFTIKRADASLDRWT